MNSSTYSPLLQYPPVMCHHPASIQTAVVVAGGGNSSSMSEAYQIHTCKHTHYNVHVRGAYAFVDQSDARSKWMHKLVQATRCFSDQLKRTHDPILIPVANASMGNKWL